MAAALAIFACLRRRGLPRLATVDFSHVPLLGTLSSISSEIVAFFSAISFSFQCINSCSLLRKIKIFLVLFQHLTDSGFNSNSDATTLMCFKELYLILYRSKVLLHYCAQSSKLWLLLQNPSVSGFFHVMNRDISTLFGVFPAKKLGLSNDITELIELLHKQTSESGLFTDCEDELLRHRLYSLLDGIEKGRVPNSEELRDLFVDKLRITDAKSCVAEIEFLEEQIMYHDCDLVINAFIDIIRYCRFSLFEIKDDELEWMIKNEDSEKQRKCCLIADVFRKMPNNFICSISRDLMKDPVIIPTGHTYDRSSIDSWIKAGHSTCPTTRQKLKDSSCMIVPNRALSRLITCRCSATGTSLSSVYVPNESLASVRQSKASMEASKATLLILVQILENGSESAKTVAAQQLRLLARTETDERLFIAESGAIPHLRKLLKSQNGITQKISVTAMLNLSIQKKNRSRIMEENDCLESIVSVLGSGHTMEAKENAAALPFCLSSTEAYQKKIADANGCIEPLAWVMENRTPRGKHDVLLALHNMLINPDNWTRMVNSGGVSAIVGALADEVERERAAKLLSELA